jgi:ABC-type iron transport system FetAB ATPase subunit
VDIKSRDWKTSDHFIGGAVQKTNRNLKRKTGILVLDDRTSLLQRELKRKTNGVSEKKQRDCNNDILSLPGGRTQKNALISQASAS